jgi:hypothetical protein
LCGGVKGKIKMELDKVSSSLKKNKNEINYFVSAPLGALLSDYATNHYRVVRG